MVVNGGYKSTSIIVHSTFLHPYSTYTFSLLPFHLRQFVQSNRNNKNIFQSFVYEKLQLVSVRLHNRIGKMRQPLNSASGRNSSVPMGKYLFIYERDAIIAENFHGKTCTSVGHLNSNERHRLLFPTRHLITPLNRAIRN